MEPQDLTPMQDVSNTQVSSHSSPDTPGKKERNSRKQCPYCHKDFHEMSLKRHIKDVHFRNQNTYVICPQVGTVHYTGFHQKSRVNKPSFLSAANSMPARTVSTVI